MGQLTIEKRPGYDWTVIFKHVDDGHLTPCSIFGVMSARLLLQQAHADAALPSEDYEIVAVFRQDVDLDNC